MASISSFAVKTPASRALGPDFTQARDEGDMDAMLNHIVLNYLIVEGHAHAIESFGRELGLELGEYLTADVPETPALTYHNIDLRAIALHHRQMIALESYMKEYENLFTETGEEEHTPTAAWVEQNPSLIHGLRTIHQRNAIKTAIVAGRVPAAIDLLKQWFPEILDHNDYLVFQLLKLNAIEMVRQRPVPGKDTAEEEFLNGVLAYVQTNLLTRARYNQEYFKELELTMALLCFDAADPQGLLPAELEQLYDLRLRETLATAVNKAVLWHGVSPEQDGTEVQLRGSECESKLARLLKLFEWTGVLLDAREEM